MDNKFELKNYQKENDIEMEIELDDYIIFPNDEIKGKIHLKPKNQKVKYDLEKLNIILKLTQFTKYEFLYEGSTGKKEESKLIINIISEKYGCYNNKESIDISLIVPKIKDFYPSFEFKKKNYFLFVRHLFTIELPELKIAQSKGIIVCKFPETIENIIKKEKLGKTKYFTIFKDVQTKKGKIAYEFQIKKLIFSLDEKIPIKLTVNKKDLEDVDIKSIEFTLEKILKITDKTSLKFWGEDSRVKKIIMFSKKYEDDEVKNAIMEFLENAEIDKNELPEFVKENNEPKVYAKEIARFIKLDDDFVERDELRFELNPSIKTKLFLCEYKVKFNIKFNKNELKEINEEFLIDLYTLKPKVIDKKIEHYFKTKESSSFEIQTEQQSDYDNLGEQNENDNGFIIMDKKDYRSALNDKNDINKKSKK